MNDDRCPICGRVRTLILGGLCGYCLLEAGLAARERVGDFELCQSLGEGGTGVVYLAEHVTSGELVALKIAKPELLDRPGLLALFHQQAKIESSLQHPNIVHVRGVGTHEGRPYIVMPLLEGGTLADDDNALRHSSAPARLRAMLTIARAVQYAHERGILHCDLKHENILFDGAGEPRVADFALARAFGAAKGSDFAEFEGGTRGWMSPEQVLRFRPSAQADRGGDTRGWMSPEHVRHDELTTASDVFALGIMLHWLGTGALPFGDSADFDTRVLRDPPPALRPWSPGLDWGLAAVVHRALQKAPTERYAAAASFVEDLERLESKRPIHGWAVPWWARFWYWTERHPAGRNAILLLLPCFALVALLFSRTQADDLRRAALDVNAYAASGQAAAVLYQLRDYAEVIERAAADPAVVALTRGTRREPAGTVRSLENPCAAQTELADATPLLRYARGFSTFFVNDADGCARARVSEEPSPLAYIQGRYDWRDYFTAAQVDGTRSERTTYVRKAYRSSVSQRIKFAVSTPLFENGQFTGVLSGSMMAASTLELPRMKRNETSDRLTVLLGPLQGEEIERGQRTPTAEFTFLAHPKLGRGKKVTLDGRFTAELVRAFRSAPSIRQFELATSLPLQRSDYVDPLLGDSWLAAFAPVGATGYVVLVQTRESVIVRPTQALRRFAIGLLAGSLALVFVWAVFVVWRRRAERRANQLLKIARNYQ